jgi:hypothetical protein
VLAVKGREGERSVEGLSGDEEPSERNLRGGEGVQRGRWEEEEKGAGREVGGTGRGCRERGGTGFRVRVAVRRRSKQPTHKPPVHPRALSTPFPIPIHTPVHTRQELLWVHRVHLLHQLV